MTSFLWPTGRWSRAIGAVALTAVLVTVVIMMGAPSAAAAEILTTDPEAGAVLDRSVETVTISFDQPVQIAAGELKVSADGQPVRLDDTEVFAGGAVYVVFFAEPISDAQVIVSWIGTDASDATATDSFTFTTGVPSAPATPAGTEGSAEIVPPAETRLTGRSPSVSALATVARSVVTSAAMLIIGGFVFLTSLHKGTSTERHLLLRIYQVAAGTILAGSVIAFLARAGELEGSFISIVDPRDWLSVAGSEFGAGTLLRIVGAAALFSGCKQWRLGLNVFHREGSKPAPQSVGAAAAPPVETTAGYAMQTMMLVAFGALVTLLSFPLMSVAASGSAAMIIEIVHVGAAAVLGGGTASLVVVVEYRRRRGQPLRFMSMAGRFLNVALGALIAATVTGFMLSVVELGSVGAFFSGGYGRILLLKLLLTAGLIATLVRSRKDFKPGASDDAAAEFLAWLDDALRVGAAIGIAVILMSSWLTYAL